MASEAYSGTANIGTTEFSLPNNSTTLTPITADGTYQVEVDFSAVVLGDEYQLRIVEKVVSGGSEVQFGPTIFIFQPRVVVLPALILLHGWDIRSKKNVGGTDRSISWSIRQA